VEQLWGRSPLTFKRQFGSAQFPRLYFLQILKADSFPPAWRFNFPLAATNPAAATTKAFGRG